MLTAKGRSGQHLDVQMHCSEVANRRNARRKKTNMNPGGKKCPEDALFHSVPLLLHLIYLIHHRRQKTELTQQLLVFIVDDVQICSNTYMLLVHINSYMLLLVS